jgi:hypothetical protein
MALRAVKHKFTGATTAISSYDPNKTNLGSLMVQKTGATYLDKYAGPLPVGITLPMQEVVYTGNVLTVTSTVVTGTGTSFTATMAGMLIGFGSIDPAKVTAWYTLGTWTSATVIAITSGPTIASGSTPFVIVTGVAMMYPHVITYSSTIDWVFLIENNAAASAPRKIFLYEFNKTTSAYTWVGFIIITLPSGANANTTRGFRALRYLHTTGTASASATAVTGISTKWLSEKIAVGARIGFGSTDPTQITNWYVISAIGSETGITLATSAGTVTAGPYVIEELRFALTVTQATAPTNGGLFLVKGINYSDFVKLSTAATTIPVATTTDNIKAVYWLSDAGTATNVVSNTSACGCAVVPEVNKGLHYAYVIDGTGSTFVKVFRYNLRASGALASGKMTMSVASYITGDVTVSSGVVTGNGTTFTLAMVGMKIGFGSQSPSMITTWYTIASFSSATSITLNNLTVNKIAGTLYVIDSADVVSTATQLVTGTISAINNGRIGTLSHGPGKDEESLYFVTTTSIYRAALSRIFFGNLGWISDNRPEIPTGGVPSFPLTNTLNVVEIADGMDRLIVLSTGTTALRNYVTRYPSVAGEQFDHIWGADEKQQDQAWALGGAYISSGTVTVSSGVVTGVRTFFTVAMVGFRIGFGTTDPTAVSTWYTVGSFASITSITLTNLTVNIGGGSSYVIDMNSNTFPHFTTSSQMMTVWSQNGIAHVIKHGTTAALCQMYALPLSAHSTVASDTNQRIITPAIYTPDCAKFQRVFVADQNRMGAGEFSITPEPWKIYFRTKGIDLNTGEWTEIGKDGDLSGLSGSRFIQFMFEFVTIGLSCIPARIMSLTVVYDDTATVTDSHYQPSLAKSNGAGKQFVWRFATSFGGTVPTLRVRLYNAVNGNLLSDDYTTGNGGTWEKSTDGTSWGVYNTTDKGNETTYIRYTPASIYDNIKVRAVLTQ